MEEKFRIGLFPVSNGREEIIPCDGYEVISDNGKFYVVKKLPQYPKSFEECCRVLGVCYKDKTIYIAGYQNKLLSKYQELLICRDAYWKIAGEELGLGKPWRPDWNNEDETKYCIYTTENIISFEIFGVDNKILAFPTDKMRNAFYENFKELIEACKELL